MADLRLRERERQECVGGADRARLLHERRRTGRINARGLELAAYLGDAEARAVTGAPPPVDPGLANATLQGSLGPWLEGLGKFGDEPRVRAALAAAGLALTCLQAASDDPRPGRALDTAQRLLSSGETSRDTRQPLVLAVESALQCMARLGAQRRQDHLRHAAHAAHCAGQATLALLGRQDAVAHWAEATVRSALKLCPEEGIRQVVCQALLPWALGDASAQDVA
jgi:hypothetical protein